MRRQITAMALSLALCGSLLSATALAAETPNASTGAAMAAGGRRRAEHTCRHIRCVLSA